MLSFTASLSIFHMEMGQKTNLLQFPALQNRLISLKHFQGLSFSFYPYLIGFNRNSALKVNSPLPTSAASPRCLCFALG